MSHPDAPGARLCHHAHGSGPLMIMIPGQRLRRCFQDDDRTSGIADEHVLTRAVLGLDATGVDVASAARNTWQPVDPDGIWAWVAALTRKEDPC